MILINLLPHREIARKRAQKLFNISLGAAAVTGALLAGAVYLWYQSEIAAQQERNNYISSEIKKLEDEIKDVASLQEEINALKARQKAVEDLQSDRNLPVHLMNEAVLQLPDGVYLKGIKQENQNVLLTGVAQSNERVSELLRNLSKNSEWVSKPELIEIVASNINVGAKEQKIQKKVYDFTIRVQLQRAKDAASSASGAGASASTPRKS